MIRIISSAALLAALLFVSCKPKPKLVKAPPAAERVKRGAPADERFSAGREMIIAGNYAEAAKALSELDAEGPHSQPMHNWITLHAGLAQQLAGNEAEARTAFEQLTQRGPLPGKGLDEVKLNAFFQELSRLLCAEEPVPPSIARKYDKWSHEAFALLVLAAKNWNAGQREDAVALFRQFGSSSPKPSRFTIGGKEEIDGLKTIARSFYGDNAGFKSAVDGLKAATTPEDKKAALDIAKSTRAEMKLKTKLSDELDAMIAEIEPQVTAALGEKARMAADEAAADAKALPEAKEKSAALLAQFQFAEARLAIMEPNLHSEKMRDEQALLVKKASWLANFKSQLVSDLATGYAKPIAQKTGPPIANGLIGADEAQVQGRAPRVGIPWSAIAPEAMFTMAQSFLLPDMAPDIAAFRKWHLGVFAHFIGKKEEARMLLTEAAALRDVFAAELPLFLDAAAKP